MKDQRKGTAYKVLELERKLAAYKKVHDEEMEELRQLLVALKAEVLNSRRERTQEGRREAGSAVS